MSIPVNLSDSLAGFPPADSEQSDCIRIHIEPLYVPDSASFSLRPDEFDESPISQYSDEQLLSEVSCPSDDAKLNPRYLPQLLIPPLPRWNSIRNPDTPETPASLSSPVVRVVDLTKRVRTTSSFPVGCGGFSDIYEGEWEVHSSPSDTQSTAKVAIKLLRIFSARPHDEVKARKRLNREVYVWHRLEHPNIAKLHGTSYHMHGRPAMVMQWYKNGSIPHYLNLNPAADRILLILEVARGLNYLHSHNPPIVHGDLKSNNVLVKDCGGAALSDFGLSMVLEELVCPTGWTLSQPDVGPTRWQAPELLYDEKCSPRLTTDVWSFGCTAYEILTSQVPYPGHPRDSQVIHAIMDRTKPGQRLHLFSQEDDAIWDILDACWNFDPEERITMPVVQERLESYLLSR